jgi:type IV pilus assembly protein PilQ
MMSSQIFKTISLIVFLFFLIGCATTKTVIKTPPPEPPPEMTKVSVIQKISFAEEEDYTRIQIEGLDPLALPFYKLLSDPLSIVIDIPNIDLKQIKGPIKIDNGTISEVSVTQFEDKGRIQIGLAQMTNYNISKEDKNLIVDVEKVKKIAEEKEETVKEKEVETSPEEPKKEETSPLPPSGVTPPPMVVKKAKEVIDFSSEQKKDFVTFTIIADGKIENYNSFKLDSPARLVLDIWEMDTRLPKKSLKVKNPFIKKVRIGHHPDKLRLVFDSLKSQLPSYQINRIQDRLLVSFGNVPQPSEPQIILQEKQVKPGKASEVIGIDFRQIDNKSRIVVALTQEPKFESRMISKNEIAVDIKNAFVPKHLQRGLDTSEFESAVNYITIKNVKTGKMNDVRILIKLREEVPYELTQEGKGLFIDIEKPKKGEAKIEAPPKGKAEEVPEEAKKEEVKKEEEKQKPLPELKEPEKVPPKVEEKPVSPPLATKKVEEEEKKITEEGGGLHEKIYRGRKISLDFKDADIKNILRLIAEVSNLNIIAGDDVTGKITMRLVDVPWDQALDVILQARGLGMTRAGNVIRVAPVDTLKKEIQGELEARRAKEKLEDLVTELIPVNYASAKDIIPQLKSVLSDRGDVKVDERTNILIVKDIPKNIAGVKNIMKFLDTKTPQVLIEARIIEATLTFQRELGISWGFEVVKGIGTTGTGTVKGAIAGTTNSVVDLPAAPLTSSSAGVLEFLLSSVHGLHDLDVQISAHENRGNVKIISSPKIATLDNKEASIEQGLRIPIPKLTTEGTITTEYVEASLKLTIVPHVTNDGNVKMSIKAKKDAPIFDSAKMVQGIPPIDKKEAITEVLIKDNGVVVIAGIYTIEKSAGTEGVPLFSKIPLLGWLFKKESKVDERKDLLIFISPKIVKDQV